VFSKQAICCSEISCWNITCGTGGEGTE
jgi:hypothetical protein